MSDPFADQVFPRGALLGAAALLGLTLLLAAAGRYSGVGVTTLPTAETVVVRELHFEDRNDGAVAVYDSVTARPVAVLEPGSNGFIRGVLRGFARERRAQAVTTVLPFRLTHWDDGRLSLADPATGRHVDLGAFGPTNAQAFARLLTENSL